MNLIIGIIPLLIGKRIVKLFTIMILITMKYYMNLFGGMRPQLIGKRIIKLFTIMILIIMKY